MHGEAHPGVGDAGLGPGRARLIGLALGPLAVAVLIAAALGDFVRVELQSRVRDRARIEAIASGQPPEAPLALRPGGLDSRPLSPAEAESALAPPPAAPPPAPARRASSPR